MTQQLKNHDAATSTLHVPRQLLDKVFAVARAEVRRGSKIQMVRTEELAAPAAPTVSRQAIAAVVWHASDQLLPAIEASKCGVRSVDAEGDASTPVEITLDVRVSVTQGLSIPQGVADLRSRVIAAMRDEIGLWVSRVDVYVDDVHHV